MRNAHAALGSLEIAVKAVSKAFKEATGVIKDVAKAAGIQEQADIKLGAALRRAGEKDAEAALASFKRFASGLQDATTVGDEAAESAASLGASMGITGKKLEEAISLSADMATEQGNLTTNMLLLGKAFKGETSTLSRYGIKIDEGLSKSEKFTAALKELRRMYGGAAAAIADTYLGRLEQMKNAFGDLKERIGAQFTPVLKAMFEELTKVFKEIGSKKGELDDLGSSFQKVASAGASVVAFAAAFGGGVVKVVQGAIGAFKAFSKIVGPVMAVVVEEVKSGFQGILFEIQKLLDQNEFTDHIKLGVDENTLKGARNAAEQARKELGNEFDLIVKDLDELELKFQSTDDVTQSLIDIIVRLKAAIDGVNLSAKKAAKTFGGGGGAGGDDLPAGLGQTAAMAGEMSMRLGEGTEEIDRGTESAGAYAAVMGQASADVISAISDSSKTTKEKIKEVIRALAAAAAAAVAQWVMLEVPFPANLAVAPAAGAAAYAIVNQLGSFHQGGVIGSDDLLHLPGMGNDEGLIMARKNEVVFTPEQMAALGNRGGESYVFQSFLPITEAEARRTVDHQLRRRLRRNRINGF